jgi:hypothetical protein
MTDKITLSLPELSRPYAETIWPAVAKSARADGYHWIAEQIEAQLPKAPVEEPTGDVVVAPVSGWFFKPGGDLGWVRDDLRPYTWKGVLDFGDPIVYRREPATAPAEVVEADRAPALTFDEFCLLKDVVGAPLAKSLADAPGKARDLLAYIKPAEPTPEQVEAASAPIGGDAIDALVQEYAPESFESANADDIERRKLRAFAARVLEVGGQQPGVPVEKVREAIRLARESYGDDNFEDAHVALPGLVASLEALLPKEPTS